MNNLHVRSANMDDSSRNTMATLKPMDPTVQAFEARLSPGQLRDSLTVILLGFVLGGLIAFVVTLSMSRFQFKQTLFKDDSECAPCNDIKCSKNNRIAHYISNILIGAVLGSTLFLAIVVIMSFVENMNNTKSVSKDKQKISSVNNQAAVNNMMTDSQSEPNETVTTQRMYRRSM